MQILIIDDDALDRQLMRAALERRGHSVDEAENGLEGVRRVRAQRPDAVIVDIFMPVMDGLEAMQEVHRECPSLPIVAISGGGRLNEFGPLMAAAAFGAARSIRKPIEPDLFADAVEEAIAATSSGRG